jgi:SNW domain-containing protein 1
MRKRELESEQRLEYAGKTKAKVVRDKERDISEKIALGQAQPTQ